MDYEYRVIPAPRRLKKIRGVTSTAELFAATLTDAINAEAREGWEYVRSESLAAEQPRGFLRRGGVVEETMMIFRRPRREEGSREPSLRELPLRDSQHQAPSVEPHRPSALRSPAAQERTRPLASRFARGEPPRDEAEQPKPRPGTGAAAPPLLRPVPRHRPGEKS